MIILRKEKNGMDTKDKKLAKVVASVLTKNLFVEANTSSSIFLFQPKAPEKLTTYRGRK